MYYVLRKETDSLSLGSYLTSSNAAEFNPGAKVVEDVLYSEQVDFPIAGRVIRGYRCSKNGILPTSTFTGKHGQFEHYARTQTGGWTLVHSSDSFSFSRLATNNYMESIIIEASRPEASDFTPAGVVGYLGGELVELEDYVRSSKYPPLPGRSEIYD